jgi:hypothetical protein
VPQKTKTGRTHSFRTRTCDESADPKSIISQTQAQTLPILLSR